MTLVLLFLAKAGEPVIVSPPQLHTNILQPNNGLWPFSQHLLLSWTEYDCFAFIFHQHLAIVVVLLVPLSLTLIYFLLKEEEVNFYKVSFDPLF